MLAVGDHHNAFFSHFYVQEGQLLSRLAKKCARDGQL